jgi:hypothetical protein
MTKLPIVAVAVVLGAGLTGRGRALAAPPPSSPAPAPTPRPAPTPEEQKEADRAFKSGVALFKGAKYAEALAEFERAYAVAPHPLVLYNMAGCHRELQHFTEAVRLYQQFLEEGPGKVPAARLTAAQTELDDLLPRIARVTVKVEPAAGASLLLDGAPVGAISPDKPPVLILAPGEHRLIARAEGRADAEQTLRVSAGEQRTIQLALPALLPSTVPPGALPGGGTTGGTGIGIRVPGPTPAPAARRFAVYAGFGTNALRVSETGVPAVGLGLGIGSRLELGVDATLVAYAIVPSVRVRIAGSALSIHAIAAAPIALTDAGSMDTFVAGAVGLGLRLRATDALGLRLESYASFAGSGHGTTVPTFVGGELWF